jgi:hypothetical protein
MRIMQDQSKKVFMKSKNENNFIEHRKKEPDLKDDYEWDWIFDKEWLRIKK